MPTKTDQMNLPLEQVTDVPTLERAAFQQYKARDQAQAAMQQHQLNLNAINTRIEQLGALPVVAGPAEKPAHNGRVTAKKQPARARAKGAR